MRFTTGGHEFKVIKVNGQPIYALACGCTIFGTHCQEYFELIDAYCKTKDLTPESRAASAKLYEHIEPLNRLYSGEIKAPSQGALF